MKRVMTAVLGSLLVVLAPGCRKDKPTQPPPITSPSLETLWPNEDGRTWNYRITARQWADMGARYYQNIDSVPPVPPLWLLASMLGTQPIGSSPVSDTATFQLKFQGQMTTASGVTAQRLMETVLRPAPGVGPSLATYVGSTMSGGFLQDLVRARPDLARRLAHFEGRALASEPLIGERPTLFLFGYAWKRTSEWIGSYGDVDTALAWKYLTRNLAPGSEFTHQLVPSLATDVLLRGRILSRQTIQTPAGTFRNAVVCLYSVDYGISEGTDESGSPMGFFRFYSYGTVTYADGVGPVGSYERRLVGLGNPSLGLYELNLALSSSSTALLTARR